MPLPLTDQDRRVLEILDDPHVRLALALVLATALLAAAFYRYDWRPSHIRHDCAEAVAGDGTPLSDDDLANSNAFRVLYELCTHYRGL